MKKWTLYGRRSCPYCVKAMNLLNERAIAYEYKTVTLKKHQEVLDNLEVATVPFIMDENGRVIGGYAELKEELHHHEWWEKITWWLMTIVYFKFSFFCKHCKTQYKQRMADRKECKDSCGIK